MYILVDCNNFYVSCERVFAPRLEKRPVIVLSNNDGCVISRSAEAKSLGIKMGEPFFKIKDFCQKKGFAVFSSNFALYGNLSSRVMSILQDEAPEIEVYSIDEAFLRVPEGDLFNFAVRLRSKIYKWTGIPTSLGIGPTKTLAKVATKIAKKGEPGVFDISLQYNQENILQTFPVADVWGIGRKTEENLKRISITTALQFRDADTYLIRKKFGITGERIQLELRGTSCLSFGEMSLKKSIVCSRSFAEVITDSHTLSLALSAHVQEACEKLRAQKSYARAGEVFFETRKPNGLRDYLGTSFHLPFPANDTPAFLSIAKESLRSLIHKPAASSKFSPWSSSEAPQLVSETVERSSGMTSTLPKGKKQEEAAENKPFEAKRCGILLFDFVQEENLETDLFRKGLDTQKQHLMAVVDCVNARFGKNTLFYASTNSRKCSWHSPRYTTCWDELALVKT